MLDATTGEEMWHYETGHWIRSQPAAANGVVYFGSYDDMFYALEIETGELLWSYKTRGAVSAGAVAVDGIAYITSWDSSIYAFGPVDE